MFSDLLLNAIASGILLGGFYAAVTVGLAISFGMLDVGNLAHPAFVILDHSASTSSTSVGASIRSSPHW